LVTKSSAAEGQFLLCGGLYPVQGALAPDIGQGFYQPVYVFV